MEREIDIKNMQETRERERQSYERMKIISVKDSVQLPDQSVPDFSEFQHCYHWTQQTTAALWIFVSLVYGPRQSQDHHCHLRQRNPRKLQNQLVDLPFLTKLPKLYNPDIDNPK